MTPETPLKACPFCGGTDLSVDWSTASAFVSCDGCGAMGPNGPIAYLDDADEPTTRKWRAIGRAAWNRRAATPGPGAIARAAERIEAFAQSVDIRDTDDVRRFRVLARHDPGDIARAKLYAEILAAELGAGGDAAT